ncbi:hypothetical protein J3458_001565 [Metarhizium acridum]|uniref:uncharacterized protein n=1 Tax=Metarhizium acridum TaxID=92637 RepID=UPI001C6D17AA|nr:hypothetical protein J3458_001565 [Metarhizium acridum]
MWAYLICWSSCHVAQIGHCLTRCMKHLSYVLTPLPPRRWLLLSWRLAQLPNCKHAITDSAETCIDLHFASGHKFTCIGQRVPRSGGFYSQVNIVAVWSASRVRPPKTVAAQGGIQGDYRAQADRIISGRATWCFFRPSASRCSVRLSISPDSVSKEGVFAKTVCCQLSNNFPFRRVPPASYFAQYSQESLPSKSDASHLAIVPASMSSPSARPRPPSFFVPPYDTKTDTSTPVWRLNPAKRCSATMPRTPSSAAHLDSAKRTPPWPTGRRRISQPCIC